MRTPRKAARWALGISLLAPFMVLLTVGIALADACPEQCRRVPREALHYKRDLIRHSRHVWGLEAPVAVLAAQIHQESRWNKDAKSAFASGMTQFTPATAVWISGAYPKDLGTNQPLNPQWALRAQSIYVKQLFDDTAAASPCDQMWKTLWKYNGGAGWVRRDERLAAKSGANVLLAREVEPFNAGRAPAF
ncbi:MAG: transglycosylase SLT domain-containing protein, partial [Gallionellaceae bacterium]